MRKLGSDLLKDIRLEPPGEVAEVIGGLCAAYARHRGSDRQVDFHFASFPPDTASGLWLELDDIDLIVIEAHTRPEHQLVIACHELWHLDEGTSDSLGPGMAVAARLTGRHGCLAELLHPGNGLDAVVRQAAARADQGDPAEIRAEMFGLHLGKLLRPYLPAPREEQFPEAIERIKTSLGWGSPVSRR
ncbi:toxin-antitoxin system, toxin component [Streptomyces xanthophaeus]|uniref:toxin-antitoxin system, toxin component n=1 Tax=Streptomyces xanthophaeus TaxID=67385 RepID=UPI0036A1F60E